MNIDLLGDPSADETLQGDPRAEEGNLEAEEHTGGNDAFIAWKNEDRRLGEDFLRVAKGSSSSTFFLELDVGKSHELCRWPLLQTIALTKGGVDCTTSG